MHMSWHGELERRNRQVQHLTSLSRRASFLIKCRKQCNNTSERFFLVRGTMQCQLIRFYISFPWTRSALQGLWFRATLQIRKRQLFERNCWRKRARLLTLFQIKEFVQCLKHKIRAWNVEKIRKDEYLDKDYKPKFSEPYMQPQPGVNFRVP